MTDTTSQVVAAMIQQRRYVDVLSFVPSDDSLNCYDAVQAALTAGYGREIVFGNPYNGQRTYRFTDRSDGRLVMPQKASIRWDTGALCDWTGWGTAGTGTAYMYAEGDFDAALTLTQDAAQGTRTVTMPSGAGSLFSPGDEFVLNSTELLNPMDPAHPNTIGEWLTVSSVDGDEVTTTTRLKYDYAISGGTVKVHRGDALCDIRLENPQIKGAGLLDGTNTRGDRGIEIINSRYVKVTDGRVRESDSYSLLITNSYKAHVSKFSSVKTQPTPSGDTRTRYGVSPAGVSSIFRIDGCDFEGGTEQVALTLTGEITGPKDNVLVTACRMQGAERSGLTTHHAYRNLSVEGNEFFDCNQAADLRLGGRFNDNFVQSTGAGLGNLDCAVQIGSGSGPLFASGNVFDDVLRGYWMSEHIDHWRTPQDISILNDRMTNVRGQGVLLNFNGANGALDGDLGTLTVKADIHLVATGFPRGLWSRGRWKNADIDLTVRGGNASARSVYMERPEDSTSLTDGAIDPIITVRQESAMLPPLVQYLANGGGSETITTQKFGNP